MDRRTPTGLDEANRLYWSSDKGVNQLADELGVSKGMLYAAIQPKPSGFPCVECGDQLVYANRTALERAMLNCPTCGVEVPESEAKLRLWDGSAKAVSNPLSISEAGSNDQPLRIDLLRERKEGAEPGEQDAAPAAVSPTGRTGVTRDPEDSGADTSSRRSTAHLSLEPPTEPLEAGSFESELALHPTEHFEERVTGGRSTTRSLLGAAALCVGLGVWIGRRWR